MERQIPKNVRQIGSVSDSPKIYVEDYVDTFFSRLSEKCLKPGSEPMGAFLVGDIQESEEETYVYVYGAIQMHDLKTEGDHYVIEESTWKRAFEDCKQYFDDAEMLGWFVVRNGSPLVPDESVVKLHQKSFPKENTVFVMKDPAEKDEVYFVNNGDNLEQLQGHYTYYEKNPNMQNYMISTRKKNGAVGSETVEDRAAKDFRDLVRSKGQQPKKKKSASVMYALSTCLVLVVVIMGVVMVNSFDKMKSVQKALENINGGGQKQDMEVQETSGTITSVIEGDGQSENDKSGEGAAVDKPSNDSEDQENEDKDDNASQAGTAEQSGGDESGLPIATGTGNEKGNSASFISDENGSNGIYVVEKGDTLAIISRKIYGDLTHVDAICRMNGISDGNIIYIGQKLLLP